ncbi:bleomycin resistance protein [Parasphingopyxis sp. CP4]|uniref:VOC family protein n=1 Tax=Parasphingopyxis sp. CP4 TaxID=2724527 RepID=UPI0015A394E0|nr:VOC family protein [Parasphingopyxis sp. CP4]QLC20876.1 bleomycin resistance protein [Parasphingopyxis sp. CP4]
MASGGIHHIDLNVSDVAASACVYGPFLEFLGYRMVRDEADSCEWDLMPTADMPHGASIGIKACSETDRSHSHRRYAPGLHHLAWRADSQEQVDQWHKRLIEIGITVLDAPAHYPDYSGDYYAVFFEDPDGMKLELVHAPGWI